MNQEWRPASQRVAGRIQRMISDGALEPGGRLPPQRELARMLDVSRATLREAITQLEAQGYIRVEPSRGAFAVVTSARPVIKQLWRFEDKFSLSDVYQMRYALEGFTVRLAAKNATDLDISKLSSINHSMLKAVKANDVGAITQCDFEFHMTIIDLAGNQAIREVVSLYKQVIIESQRLPLYAGEYRLEPVEEHTAVIRALARRDAEIAAVALRNHIARAAERLNIELIAS